jgi:hypothetical protein
MPFFVVELVGRERRVDLLQLSEAVALIRL